MKQISYHNLTTSSLGFGCASLSTLPTLKQALATLETAYEHGITHFDAARLYGSGVSESILGRFLRNRRDGVTITTKLGLNPPAVPQLNQSTIFMLKKVIRSVPGLEACLMALLTRQRAGPPRFSAAEAKKSLETSLKELATDYVDILLLHECSLSEANAEEILEFLEGVVRNGKARYCGVGTAFENLPKDLGELNQRHAIVQTESNAVQSNLAKMTGGLDRLYINYGAFKHVNVLAQAGRRDGHDQRSGLGDYMQAVCADKEKLGRLLLLAARRQNPHGVVLFASTRPENIIQNVKTWNSYEANAPEAQKFQHEVDKLAFVQ